MKKRRKRSQSECHMTYGIPCSPQPEQRSQSGFCFRMCKKVFINRFGMKVKPTSAASFDGTKRQKPIPIAITTKPTATPPTIDPYHLQFDSLPLSSPPQSATAAATDVANSESITITLNQNVSNVDLTKIDSFKLMRTPSHEMLMWQTVTDAFGSLLRYAQDSMNVFFCPM